MYRVGHGTKQKTQMADAQGCDLKQRVVDILNNKGQHTLRFTDNCELTDEARSSEDDQCR